MSTIEIPSFDFAGVYYPELLERLIRFKRGALPELTDESPQEPLIQLLRAFALTGHLSHTLLDLVANESTLPTARLPASVRNLLRLIGYEMSPATPAQVDLVYELAQVLAVETEIVPEFAQAATPAAAGDVSRYFEADAAVVVQPTDTFAAVLAIEDDVATDVTEDANDSTPGTQFTPWASPVGGSGGEGTGREGDSLMVCHGQALWDVLGVVLHSAGSGLVGVWEWYDGRYVKAKPTGVTMPTSKLVFDLTDYLGTASRAGTRVRVQLTSTGAYEDAFVEFAGGVNKVTLTAFLGQSSPSLTAADYVVGSAWNEFTGLVDGTSNLTGSGDVEFTLPQTLTQDWIARALRGTTGYWMRYRLISVSTPTAPAILRLRLDTGKQYVKANATQGRSHADNPIGSSNGAANQRFAGSKSAFIVGSDTVFVDDVAWTRVDNFLASRATDRHYRVELGDEDVPTFIFGDGVTGAIPPAGVSNISVTYRYGADVNGNVGAGAITIDKAGLAYVNAITNPRPATGWVAAEGADAASLERVKIEGPASLRVREVALGPDDVEALALRASKLDTSIVGVTRAKAIEGGFGPKTIELVVVPAGGAAASTEQLDAMSLFFNGDALASPPVKKRIVANQEVTAVNFAPRTVDLTITVKGGTLTEAEIEATLLALLQPEARKEDGVTFEWAFGGRVAMSYVGHKIFALDNEITDVDIAEPDIELEARELPVAGTITITIT